MKNKFLVNENWIWPLFAYAVHKVLVIAGGFYGRVDPFDHQSYIRWDSGHYLSIAANGYTAAFCNYPDTDYPLCGNAAWMPLYSLLIRWIGAIVPFSHSQIAVVMSHLLGVTLYICLWALLLRKRGEVSTFWPCALMSVFPGAIFFDAAFPMSLTCLLAVSLIYSCHQRKFIVGAIVSYLLALSYSSGWVFVCAVWLGCLIEGFFASKSLRKSVVSKEIMLPVGGFLGAITTFYIMWQDTGYWDLFFRTQAAFSRNAPPPFTSIIKTYAQGIEFWNWNLHRSDDVLVLFTGIMIALIAVFSFRSWYQLDRVQKIVAVSSIVVWIFPMTMGNYPSFYRANTLVIPIICLFTVLPLPWRRSFVFLFMVLSLLTSRLFFRGILM